MTRHRGALAAVGVGQRRRRRGRRGSRGRRHGAAHWGDAAADGAGPTGTRTAADGAATPRRRGRGRRGRRGGAAADGADSGEGRRVAADARPGLADAPFDGPLRSTGWSWPWARGR